LRGRFLWWDFRRWKWSGLAGLFALALDEGAHFGHHLIMRDAGAQVVDGFLHLGVKPAVVGRFVFGAGEAGRDGIGRHGDTVHQVGVGENTNLLLKV